MNNTDPLAQLRDIHLPEPTGFWPPAPGWWLLAALVLAALGAGLVLLIRHHRRGAYRREARRLLDLAWAHYREDGDAQAYLATASQLLRRTAIAAYPDADIRRCHGQDWLDFLDQCIDNQCRGKSYPFAQGPGRALATAPYRPNVQGNLEPLHQLMGYWLHNHRRRPRGVDQWREVNRVAV